MNLHLPTNFTYALVDPPTDFQFLIQPTPTIPINMPALLDNLEPVSALKSAEQGHRYLLENARQFVSDCENGESWKDNFVDAMLLEVTGNWNLVSLPIPAAGKKWNYFGGKSSSLTTDPYPEDIDTNALLPTIIKPQDSAARELMNEMLEYETAEGIIPVGIKFLF